MHDEARYRAAEALLMRAEDHPQLQPLRNSVVLLRLWQQPSFTAWISWTVIRAQTGLVLRRLVWHRDVPESVSSEPVIAGADALLPLDQWKPMLARLHAFEFKPFALDDVSGRDGTTSGVELMRAEGSARLSWWEGPPAGWEGLAAWHAQAIAAFQALLPVNIPPAR